MLRGLQELRPGVPTIELPDSGHYPQIEDAGGDRRGPRRRPRRGRGARRITAPRSGALLAQVGEHREDPAMAAVLA